jgi:hypothetical protein
MFKTRPEPRSLPTRSTQNSPTAPSDSVISRSRPNTSESARMFSLSHGVKSRASSGQISRGLTFSSLPYCFIATPPITLSRPNNPPSLCQHLSKPGRAESLQHRWRPTLPVTPVRYYTAPPLPLLTSPGPHTSPFCRSLQKCRRIAVRKRRQSVSLALSLLPSCSSPADPNQPGVNE